MTDEASRAFNARLAYWTSRGLSGPQVYEALANDPELPATFGQTEVADILGITPSSVKKKRNRQTGPNFVRVSPKEVRYPRHELCSWLAAMFVRVAA